MNSNSFVAADRLPVKLIQDWRLVRKLQHGGRIKPVHVQMITTNRCNMNCTFCSCADDDRETEMSLEAARHIILQLQYLGCRSVTITGGGEPLMHPNFEEIMLAFHTADIKIGLVTNGTLLYAVDPDVIGLSTWCRISHADERGYNPDYFQRLHEVVKNTPQVDWAFSYVVSPNPNLAALSGVLSFAKEHEFTHTRLVADLHQPDKVDLNGLAHTFLDTFGSAVWDRVILQSRNKPERGGPCFIGFLKPVIGADCKIYACCGVQYAFKEPTKNLPQALCIGDAMDILELPERSRRPLLAKCYRCYYGDYNRVLAAMMMNVEHGDFV